MKKIEMKILFKFLIMIMIKCFQDKRFDRHEEMIMQLIEIVGHTNKKLDNLIEYQTEKLKFYYKIILKYVVDL